MIEVRIRHVDQSDAVRLMDWDPTNLSGAIRLVTGWSVSFEDGTEYSDPRSFTGRIVSEDGTGAYFEIVVSDDFEGPDA